MALPETRHFPRFWQGTAGIVLGMLGYLLLVLTTWMVISCWMVPLGISGTLLSIFPVAMAMLPGIWMCLHSGQWGSEISLILVIAGMVFGDALPAVSVPVLMAITAPHCVKLLHQYRHTKLRTLLFPLLLLIGISVLSAFLLNSVGHPVIVTNRMQTIPGTPALELGGASALLSMAILYPLLYIPLLLADLSIHRPAFLNKTFVGLSMLTLLLLLIGIAQFVQSGGTERISSLMRLPTRFGPFVVVTMAMTCIGLIEVASTPSQLINKHLKAPMGEPAKKYLTPWLLRAYWIGLLTLSLINLMGTQTRIAIIAAAFLMGMLMVALFVCQQKKAFWFFFGVGIVCFSLIAIMTLSGQLDLLERFQASSLQTGSHDRELIMQDFANGMTLENATSLQTWLHFLLGFGVFRERELAHFNLHDTVSCAVAVFGWLGALLYYSPYGLILGISLKGFFQKQSGALSSNMRPRFAMAASVMLTFFMTGAFHNKLYSPIETAFLWLVIGLLLAPQLPALIGKHGRQLTIKPAQKIRF